MIPDTKLIKAVYRFRYLIALYVMLENGYKLFRFMRQNRHRDDQKDEP